MGKVMEELLIKAQRDKSKLVQVQRSVSRNGKTFMQNFWVQPSQVKASDKVIGGQQNLLPKAGSVPKPAAGVLDKAYFESIKSDRTNAIDYLKSCGVQWNVHSHAGINWMRAMQAYNAAVGNQNGGKTASTTTTQPTSQATTQTAQVAQNTQGKGVTLTAAQQAEVDAGKNGKEKVVILKKLLGKDGCMEYAKQLGVTWDEHSMDAINNMRMSMALSKHFDTTDGTVSPTGGKGGKGGGAPKGNQNAKKDEVKKDDTIKVTASHTPRQVALIGLINGITDPKELELIKSTGIVAEDDDAKVFIEKTLKPAYYKKDNGRPVYRGDSKKFGQASSDNFMGVLKGLPKRLVSSIFETMSKENEGLNMAVLQNPREIVAAFGSGGRGKRAVGESGVSAGFTDKGFLSIMADLHKLSQLSDDISLSNTGQPNDSYGELLTAERVENLYKKYGADAYGVMQAIHHISDKDPTVKAEADKMASQYSSMLDKCNHGFTALQTVLGNKYSYIEDQIETSEMGKKRIDAAIKYFLDLKSQYNMSDDDIAESVYSLRGYGGGHILQRADGTPILDSNGNQIDLCEDLKVLGRSMGDDRLYSYLNDTQATRFLETALTHGKTYDTLTQADFNDYNSHHSYWGGYQSPLSIRETARQFQGITQDSYSQVRTTYLDFVGQNVQRYDSMTDSYVDVDTSKWGAAEWSDFDDRINDYVSSWSSTKREFRLVSNGDNPQKDTILANFHGISAHISMMENIQDHVPDWCPASKANDQGNDLSKNFSYLTSRQAERGTMYWAQGTKMTGDQVNAQILAQLKDTPVVTSATRSKLIEYAEKHGTDTVNYGSGNPLEVQMNKAKSLNMSYFASIQDYQGTPMNDIIVEQIMSVAHCCPQMFNTRVKTQDDVDKIVKRAMGYIDTSDSGTSDLLALRQQAFAKVHCSLRTADQTQRDSIETRVKQDWDKGKRTSAGRRLYGNISFVGHGVYQIQNSEADEIFRESVKKTGEKPQSFFHGTSFQGACGIVGVDGKFRAPKDSADAAKQGLKYAGGMLGPGVYLADLAGKSAGYFGTWGSGYSHGALLVCDAILGKHATASDYSSVKTRMDVDSVSMKAGTNTGRTVLRADEWCVRRNDYVSPQFIVDAEAIPR